MPEETGLPDQALSELAMLLAVTVERAPGPLEKRLALLRGFAQAHQINPAVTDNPDLALLDSLIREPHRLVHNLVGLWTCA